MRTPISSPFSPGSDTVPAIWAGRVEQLSDWRDVLRPRRMNGSAERGRVVLGEPGSGKSSLVRKIAREAAQDGDWVTPQIRLAPGADPVQQLAAALLSLADEAGLSASREARIAEILQRVETVAVSGVSLTMRASESRAGHVVLSELLIEIGRAALRNGHMVLIHLDEVQNMDDDALRSQLLIALGDALAHEEPVTVPGGLVVDCALPLAVYLTGLTDFADVAGAEHGATFARRFQTTVLEPLSDDDLASALQELVMEGWEADDLTDPNRVHLEAEARDALVTLVKGDPFLFQLAGEGAWYAGRGDVITREEVLAGWALRADEAERHVARLLSRLPDKERDFIDAMAELPPESRTLTSIARAMGYENARQVGVFAQRLDVWRKIISRGKPYTFRSRVVGAYVTSGWPLEDLLA